MLADALASVRLDGYALGEVSGAARDDAGVCLAACGEAGAGCRAGRVMNGKCGPEYA